MIDRNYLMNLMLKSVCKHEFEYLSIIVTAEKLSISFSSLYSEGCSVVENYPEVLIKEVEAGGFENAEELKRSVAWDAILREVAEHGVYTVFATRYERDGSLQCKRYQFSAVDGGTEYLLGTARDVTDTYLKESQNEKTLAAAMKEAQAANQAKTDFLARMTHDIRTPMNAIIGLTDLTFDDVGHPEIVVENLRKIKTSGDYLLGLLNDILDMAKIEDGSITLNKDVYHYADFLLVLETIFVPQCQKKNITFKFEQVHGNLAILTDKVRLNQIFCNILSNAVKYTPEGGTIVYRTENLTCDEDRVSCDYVIADNGIGMSEEFQLHMFDAFMQENDSVSAQLKGAGLGLSITKNLIELMGGTIHVTSKVDQGTEVRVHLSFELAGDDALRVSSTTSVGAEGLVLAGKRVLLVEDHPLNAEIARRHLEKRRIGVEHASNGRIGVEMFCRSAPGYYDAVIMDIRMPDMNGLEAARAIRSSGHVNAQSVPIIAMTANAYDEDVRRSFAAGMDAHLSKPINPEELFRTLAQLTVSDDASGDARDKILIVDDSDVSRAVLRAALDSEFDIFEAKDGIAALEILDDEPGVCAVITDVQMPGMDGVTLIERIRERSEHDRMAILANTQFGDADQGEKLLRVGADDFIYKPTTSSVVTTRLHNVLQKYR